MRFAADVPPASSLSPPADDRLSGGGRSWRRTAPHDRLRWTGCGGALLLGGAAWIDIAGGSPPSHGARVPVLAAEVAGTGLVVLSWALLGVVLARGTVPTARWLIWTLVSWCAPLLVAPPLFSRDVFSYLAQGELAALDLDPRVVSPAQGLGAASDTVERMSAYWRDTPSPYGPVFGAIERLIAEASTGDVVAGVALHRLVEVSGLVLIVWAVRRLAAAVEVSQSDALWLGVLNPLVPWHIVGGAHNDGLMLGLMLAGSAVALQALRERIRWRPLVLGVVLIALAAAVKLVALVALVAVGTAVARQRGGTLKDLLLAGAAMGSAFTVVAILVSQLTGLDVGWRPPTDIVSRVDSWMAPTNWFGFLAGGVGSAFGVQIKHVVIAVGRAVGGVLALWGITVVVLGQLRGRIGATASLATMMGLIVVLGPVVQPWYLLWAVVPLAATRPGGNMRARLAALVAVFAVLVPPLAGDFTGRVGHLVVGYAIGILVVGAALLVLHGMPRGARV